MRGSAAGRVHGMHLAVVASDVRCDQGCDRLGRGLALAQQRKPVGAVERIDQCLGCHRPDFGGDERHARADSEEPCRDRNAE
jgi:hypothetical protein